MLLLFPACLKRVCMHESPADFPFPHTPARTFDDISLTHLSRCPPACPSGPIRDLSGSSPFRHPINPKITLWWTCDQCNYKIFQHEDLPCPYHKRIRHLSIAHKIKKVDIPPLPEVPTPPPSGKWIAMSQFLCDRIEKQGWNGIHLVNLNPKDDKQRLICTICHETFTTWNKVPSNSCPQNAKGSVKTISGTQKRKLWTTWYTQAQKHAKEYIQQCSKDLIETMFKVNQAANDSRWPAEPPKPLGGLPCMLPNLFLKFGGRANSVGSKSLTTVLGLKKMELEDTTSKPNIPMPVVIFQVTTPVALTRPLVSWPLGMRSNEDGPGSSRNFVKFCGLELMILKLILRSSKSQLTKLVARLIKTPVTDVGNAATPSQLVKFPLQFARTILAKFLLSKNGKNSGSNVMTLLLRRKRIVVAVVGLAELRLQNKLRFPHTKKLPCPKEAQVPPVPSVAFVANVLERLLILALETF